MTTYTITNIKTSETITGTIDEAIARAEAMNNEYQPAFGTQIEEDGKTVYDTEDREYYV